ncbi:Pentatricopeptide repeat (PPR) superfamily protein [Rhynchospora pubera]|uniref:Pentatricopeptide repeat (PPR) superfamily protein n=1 Tax=Rhynchospora pubera TaxID=906938 RepID=A0AAV8F5V1_9POAL|nr:Pentatricopeptide repeat (PPR) superfamily protein [Rhynchospora pubera]
MYRVVGALRRSHASHVISRDYSLASFWGLIERFKIGAGYDSNKAANNVVQSKLPTHSPVNKDVEHKQHGFGKDQKRYDGTNNQDQRTNNELLSKPVTRNISADEKRKFLINMLFDLKDSKESVYVTLDAWVASEPTFPLASLREALVVLEKHKQWHRLIQVIEWILSKGRGNTMGTYKLLIKALDKENRAEEAHRIWETKIGHNLRYVSWPLCDLMLSIYHRNNMLDQLVKLFRSLESCGRRPRRKSLILIVADAYEILGLSEEKDKLFTDYSYLFDKSKENKRIYNKSKEAKKGD